MKKSNEEFIYLARMVGESILNEPYERHLRNAFKKSRTRR